MGLETVREMMAGGVAVTPDPELDAGFESGFESGPEFDDPGFDPPRDPGQPVPDDAPPEARCVDLPLNDFGNGQRLVVHFGADLLAVPRVGWFRWDGCRFALDPDALAVRRLAHGLGPLIEAEVDWLPMPDRERQTLADAEDAEKALEELGVIKPSDRSEDQIAQMAAAERLVRAARDIRDRRAKSIGRRLTHAKNAGNTNAIKNLLTEAGAIIARPAEDLDRDPLLVNTLGGVIRFRMVPGEDDGGQHPPRPVCVVERQDHSRDQLLTKIMPVAYDPAARAPLFEEVFLPRIQPVPEMRRFIQRWAGYSMLGLTNEQKFAFWYGSGANGKSVLADLIAKILGDYAATAKIESITGKNRRGGGEATPDLVPLIGARFVRTSEPDEGQRLQEGLIKELTGGEPIMVRSLNENFVTVYPIFKLTVSGNHKPEIHGGDDGIWRRVMLVPFDVQIPLEERDPEIGAKLFAEAPGILNWLIEGARQYLEHGLQVPEQVSAATAEYREDSDPLATFLTRCCVVTGQSGDSLRAKDLTAAFLFWLREGGQGEWSERTVFKRLKAKAGRWKHPVTQASFVPRKASDAWYDGLVLAPAFKAGGFDDWWASEQLRRLGMRGRPADSGGDE